MRLRQARVRSLTRNNPQKTGIQMKRTYIIPTAAMLLAFTQAFAFNPLGLFSDSKAKEPAGRHIGLTDSRDGKAYMIVTIGNQTWMAENLNYRTSGSKCYNNNENYCDTYGRLYTWREALSVCPDGWHLPSKAEFTALTERLGGSRDSEQEEKENAYFRQYNLPESAIAWKTAGQNLKSKYGWMDNGHGDDWYGFGALPAGGYNNVENHFFSEGGGAFFWSSSDEAYQYAYTLELYSDYKGAVMAYNEKGGGYSVRCIKNK